MVNVALIVAGGSGTRMGGDTPKQFHLINEKPLLVYTIEAFNKHPEIDSIVVVTSKEYIQTVKDWLLKYDLKKLFKVVEGGKSRQDSVYNGLKVIDEFFDEDDIVLIHDAARPLVSASIISENISACHHYDAVTTAIPTSDTILKVNEYHTIEDIPNRDELYQCQTPQTFRLGVILSAHEMARNGEIDNVTDDTKLVMAVNKDVFIVRGDKYNFKVTTPEDMLMLKALLERK